MALLADGQRIEVRVEPATDAASVDACSAALRAKYAHASGLRGMLAEENLPTTLELLPIT